MTVLVLHLSLNLTSTMLLCHQTICVNRAVHRFPVARNAGI